jgi:SAM-dependent methyltransferase
MTSVRTLGVLLLIVAASGCSSVPGQEVPYIVTPLPIVDAMLQLAEVAGDDVVYDLGSGDGRIVIAAARDYGAHGIGIEIDPRLVAESTRRAEQAGVGSRVRFMTQDVFEADLRQATVVTLYMTRELNLRLRPKLLAELPPGARVVSHRFDMGDWKPERQETMELDGRQHVLYLWRIP